MRRNSSAAQERFYGGTCSRVSIKSFAESITQEDRVYFGGSCFAENLFSFWKNRFLPCALSPFGSIYNPLSLKDCFTLLAEGRIISREEISFQNGLWTHPLFNSTVSHPDQDEFLNRLNTRVSEGRRRLNEASFLILTLGTAFVYGEKESGEVVSNCHRRPSTDFVRRQITVEECTAALCDLTAILREQNPELKIIISLSPVRHLRDDAAENSLSKAVLRCGIDAYLKRTERAVYFPSYEILLDELRDYRWYESDLAHPGETAVAYIMDRFCEAAASPSLQEYLKEAEKLSGLLKHRLRFPDSPDGIKFISRKRRSLEEFGKKYPFCVLPEGEGGRE